MKQRKYFENDVLSIHRLRVSMVMLARETGDPLNELWALRADALRARGLTARLEELDEAGHPVPGVPLDELVERHGLAWANLVYGTTEQFARYGPMVVD